MSLLDDARAAAESRMTSRVSIHRETYPAPPETDAAGFTVRSFTTVATDVPFRMPPGRSSGRSRTVRVGDSEVQVATREGHFPVGTQLDDEDLVHITAGENAGLWLRVIDGTPADQATALRVEVVEDQKPEVL